MLLYAQEQQAGAQEEAGVVLVVEGQQLADLPMRAQEARSAPSRVQGLGVQQDLDLGVQQDLGLGVHQDLEVGVPGVTQQVLPAA
jgi:hypothetical protein